MPDGPYERWRREPPYRLLNLASDPSAWPALALAPLEVLVFDQCLVFGAAYPGDAAALDRAARRDRVVRLASQRLRTAYRCYAARALPQRRARLAHDVARAVADGAGSPASLLPFVAWDGDGEVRAAAGPAAPHA